jgi:short-subunit dehydrogenase
MARTSKALQLEDAVVVVTGAAGGIGSALGDGFERAGATVVRTDLGGVGDTEALDVTDLSATRRLMHAVVQRHGRLDVVVANAGIGAGGLVEDLSDVDWERTIDVNIVGSANTLRAAYPIMCAAGRGSIVLMASLAGLAGTPLLAAYSMSKSAMVGLGAAIRPEAARHGVGVTVVCPGPVETPLLDSPTATPGMSVRRYLVASAGAPLSPERLADAVLRGVRRNRALVVPGRAGLLWRVERLSPTLVRLASSAGLRRELAAAEVGAGQAIR